AIQPNGYLVVFASNKNRRDPSAPLHTNFALSASGEYLGLIKPDGTTVASEYAPSFPPQSEDVSYGTAQGGAGELSPVGFFRVATPGAVNGGSSDLRLMERVIFSRNTGPFSNSFLLELSGGGAGQVIRYVVAPPSEAGANVPAPTSTSPEYNGPISITSSTIVRAAVFSADGSIVHGLDSVAHYLSLSPALSNFSSQLPLVVLDNHGLGLMEKDDIDRPAWIYTYEPSGSSAVFAGEPGFLSRTTMKVHGNFTALFPKKSYSLELRDNQDRANPQPLLGLDSSEDWALISPWMTDRSYIRNAYVYALSNRLGRWAPRTQFVEVFANTNADGLDLSDYAGIGVVTDRVKIGRDRIDIATLEPSDIAAPAITGGYVIKFDPLPDPDHYSFTTERGIPSAAGTGLVVDSPKADKLSQPQRDYIRNYVQEMENALFADQASGFASRTYLDYIDLPSWVDHHLLEVFVANVDGLTRSEYFYKDRDGKLVSGPAWDFDGTMGSGDERNANWDTWNTAGEIDLWSYGWWGPLTRDPEFMQAWVDRWQLLRQHEFSEFNLHTLADSLAAQIGPEAAARDAARWPENEGRFPGGFLGEVSYLKNWIANRATWIDQQFLAAPVLLPTGATIRIVPPAGALLVYTLDGSDPRSLGGAVAPGAITTATAVEIPDSANFHARSYRAALAGVFPGSPWSSAVGGANSSPLTPRARLINLSSRGYVSGGENTLIAGIVITDTKAKRFLTRGIGPTLLQYGATGVLPDPQLSLFAENGVELYRNNGWQSGPDGPALPKMFLSVGAFALTTNSADSALTTPIASGAYSLQITSPSGQSGVSLVEAYELDGNGRTRNLSTRAFVGTGGNVLIGGFVVQGPAYQRILVRAVGPTLRAYGLTNALVDPVLTMYAGETLIASNDRWTSAENVSAIRQATSAVGAFELADSEDAVLLLTVPPGAYSVVVSGKAETEGVALLEIYSVP
ncbi:MAG: CotH kinase family protein, partial [Opitutaceae bacterium]